MDSCHRLKNNGSAFVLFCLFCFVFLSYFKLGLSLFMFLCAYLMITKSDHFPDSALFSLHIFMSAFFHCCLSS